MIDCPETRRAGEYHRFRSDLRSSEHCGRQLGSNETLVELGQAKRRVLPDSPDGKAG